MAFFLFLFWCMGHRLRLQILISYTQMTMFLETITVPTRSILLMEKDSLWKRALSSLVSTSGSDINLITSQASNLDELIGEISQNEVSVVLLGESSMPSTEKDSLTQLLMVYPKLRVIVVSEDSNWLYVFQKEDFLLTGLTDLLNVINPD